MHKPQCRGVQRHVEITEQVEEPAQTDGPVFVIGHIRVAARIGGRLALEQLHCQIELLDDVRRVRPFADKRITGILRVASSAFRRLQVS